MAISSLWHLVSATDAVRDASGARSALRSTSLISPNRQSRPSCRQQQQPMRTLTVSRAQFTPSRTRPLGSRRNERARASVGLYSIFQSAGTADVLSGSPYSRPSPRTYDSSFSCHLLCQACLLVVPRAYLPPMGNSSGRPSRPLVESRGYDVESRGYVSVQTRL